MSESHPDANPDADPHSDAGTDSHAHPEPTPTPTPQPVACHPAPDDPRWGQPKPAVYTLYPEYQKAIQAVGDRCGFADGTEVPQRQTLDLIAAKWRELFPGWCVASPASWGGSGETVSAKDPSGDFVEIHAVYFGNGCIIDGTNAFRAMWPCPGCVPSPEPYPYPDSWPDSNASDRRLYGPGSCQG